MQDIIEFYRMVQKCTNDTLGAGGLFLGLCLVDRISLEKVEF